MSLTDRTISGFFWAFLERFGVQGISLVIFVVLARLLTPEQFGLIGMLTVFIAISQTLVDSGFSQALIQKKDPDEIDFSSVFFINLLASIFIYGILYICAPFIADFYGEPILTSLTRVLGLKFIIASFSLVQIAKLTKSVDFKSLMIAKLPSTLLGGVFGIGAAYLGYGVWSLIIHQLIDATAYSVQLWFQSGWVPRLVFRKERIKPLFSFGSRIMISSVINTIYQNIYAVVIGKFFTAAQVGYYTQADKISKLPVQNISSALGRVTFPVLAEIQNDNVRLKKAYKKIIRQVSLFIIPIMLGAIVLAMPLFDFVLGEKWLPAVPYFQWLCVTALFFPLNSYNVNILKVKGRSDIFLRLEVIKKTILTIGIAITIQYSVLAVVIFNAVSSLINYVINSYYSGVFINYSLGEQVKDIYKVILASTIMAGILWVVKLTLVTSALPFLLINILIGIGSYLIVIYYFERELLVSISSHLKSLIQSKKKTQDK